VCVAPACFCETRRLSFKISRSLLKYQKHATAVIELAAMQRIAAHEPQYP
jgi:hypothetical protein